MSKAFILHCTGVVLSIPSHIFKDRLKTFQSDFVISICIGVPIPQMEVHSTQSRNWFGGLEGPSRNWLDSLLQTSFLERKPQFC